MVDSLTGEIVKQEPRTRFFFHNSRPNRKYGRSMKEQEEGGIFYYEALDERQCFQGYISCDDPGLLKKMLSAFPSPFSDRLGRSRSAQYGSVRISLNAEKIKDATTRYPKGEYILVLKSPLLLINDMGFSQPSESLLLEQLEKVLSLNQIRIRRADAKILPIEQYNSAWASKSGKYLAFKEGSSFHLELLSDATPERPLEFLGAWNDKGFGAVSLESMPSGLRYYMKDSQAPMPSTQEKAEAPPLLEQIKTAHERDQLILEVKLQAVKEALKMEDKATPNNHLISRMNRLFEQSQSRGEIIRWVNNTKGKPAGDAMKKAHLLNPDHHFLFKWSKEEEFFLDKIYWTTFFQTLRKKKKS